MSIQWDVLGLGAVAVDDLIYVDHYPAADTKEPVRSEERVGGGLAGTALVAAARLGAKAAYLGVLGDDELSRFTLQELTREGVDCSQVLHRPGARPFHSTIVVDQSTGQRCIFYSGEGVTEPPAEEIRPERVAACRTLFIDSTVITAGIRAGALAQQVEIPVVADVESLEDPRLTEFLRYVDHLILSLEFASRLAGTADPESTVRILGRERTCCVATAGARGCWYSGRGSEPRHFQAFPIHTVDTLGCGDVFHGAYAAAIARGEPVARAIAEASAAAAIKATQHGGRAGIPSRPALTRFLKEHGID